MKFTEAGSQLLSEAGMFWCMPSVPINGGQPWILLCLARVRIRGSS